MIEIYTQSGGGFMFTYHVKHNEIEKMFYNIEDLIEYLKTLKK